MAEDEFFGRPKGVASDPAYVADQQSMNEAFRKGLGDAALSMDDKPYPVGNKHGPFPETLDAEEWSRGLQSAGDALDGPTDAQITAWFRAAIQAGYNAARPLDPDTVYAGGEEIDAKMVFGALDALKAVDVQPKPFFEGQGVQSGPHPFAAMQALMQADAEYAWGWHCNLAVPIMDALSCSHEDANKVAAHLMSFIWGVDITKDERFEAFGYDKSDATRYHEARLAMDAEEDAEVGNIMSGVGGSDE